jgi:hypothetical protein
LLAPVVFGAATLVLDGGLSGRHAVGAERGLVSE